MDSFGAPLNDALPPSGIRELVASAARGFLTNSKRGHRIYRKVAGTLCQRAREELGFAGLLWSKAAWDGSLHAAMAGLQALAGTADTGLQDEKVLTSIREAHLEGLKQPATASSGVCRARQRPPRPATHRAQSTAAQGLARSFCGPEDIVPYALYCHKCGASADCGLRGSKEGGQVKYVCDEHADSYRYFSIDKDRAALGRAEAKVVGQMDQTRSQSAYNHTFQRSGLYYNSAPKSRRLTATLLIIGGIEPNPGWGGNEVSDSAAQDRTTLGSDIDRGWPLIPLPSLEEVYGSPPLRQAQSMHSEFEAWRSQARLSEQMSGGNQRSATSAANESGSELSDSEDEGEDIEGAEFESVDEPQDVETSRDRAFIDDEDASEDEENEVIAQGRFRAARESSSDSDVPLLLARRFKPQAPGRATKALQTSCRARSPSSWSKASAEEGSPSQGSSSTVSVGGWADQQLPPATGGRIRPQRSEEAAMDTDSGSDELPGLRKRRVLDGAARSPQIRRRRRVLLSSSESSGGNGSVLARRCGAAGSEEEVQHRGREELVPSDDDPPDPEDDGGFVIVPSPWRLMSDGQVDVEGVLRANGAAPTTDEKSADDLLDRPSPSSSDPHPATPPRSAPTEPAPELPYCHPKYMRDTRARRRGCWCHHGCHL
ncbi:hypothetical protein KFL_011430020 [Klebsormidium nitens]|uniref:Uncharacterized protein n=1 Tax=Klebsormidium nitens TaxID=105231 RepID=A0A1Y1IX03_KLENI|nr:hypothetical protein KFL_011430020 [Klebsormidium nitens]|eukprot:GAQ92798.1 hypothetical protein KFL_011430020 [Klebsormidium nitens]